MMKCKLASLVIAMVGALCASGVSAKSIPQAGEWVRISDALSPLVEYSLERNPKGLTLAFRIEGMEAQASDVSLRVGVAADRSVILDSSMAEIQPSADRAKTFLFRIPASKLVESPNGWDNLRLAFEVTWQGQILGQPRLKQRFRHIAPGAVHAGLSGNPAEWQPLDLVAWERGIADRKLDIAIDFEQPMDGRATVVIEDESGNRIRNLVSGEFFEKGPQRIVWDGMDDKGVFQTPGNYRWRAISHPGIKPVYMMSFADAPGSNHGTFHAAGTNGKQVVLGTPLSEGGHQVVVLEKDGTFVRGFNAPHGAGLGRIQVTADDKFAYAAYDGTGWGTHVDRSKKDWKAPRAISLMRFEIATGNTVEFPGKKRIHEVASYEIGPGSPNALPDILALRGLALYEGKLYLADALNDLVHVIDPASGDIERTFALEQPVALASGQGALYAIARENKLLTIDPASGVSRELSTLAGKPVALARDSGGNLYVSDQEANVVRVLNSEGREVRTIGHPGGIALGAYDPLRFHQPEGLTVIDDEVWVTEKQRWTPKRFAAFDTKTGHLRKEFFGPTAYGAPGAGFDPQDEGRWIGMNTLFEIDFDKKTAKPLSILGLASDDSTQEGYDGRRYTFWRQDGRTFVISSGKITAIQELTSEGTLKPLAFLSSAHQFCFAHKWDPPQVFIEAFQRDYPTVKLFKGEPGGVQAVRPDHGYGMLWVDRNGDSQMQLEEIEFATTAENVGGNGWSHDFHDLTLRVLGKVEGQNVLVTLQPDGWWPGGAPKYPPLAEAVAKAVPVDFTGNTMNASAVDRFGNIVVNSSPLQTFSPEGKLLWTYPNEYVGVHGSHKAPLPQTGELQGALFFSGVAPLDDVSDVFVMNGNHGRAFVMTTDGMYLDEMFSDVRMVTNQQGGGIGVLGGECFGGTFGKSEKTGNYYFQGGGIMYRIYRIDGLKEAVRQQGNLAVTSEQLAAAERGVIRRLSEKPLHKDAVVVRMETAPVIDGRDGDWKGISPVTWDNQGKFPVMARMGFDDTHLYLFYKVRDSSPWVNQGRDWQALFKTGDGVDLQLGSDASADPRRSNPVPGDFRLFIAPSADGDKVVLYRHRVPGAEKDEGVVFQSPIRHERVDVVKLLDSAKVAVAKGNGEYIVEVAVPLEDLGLSGKLEGASLRGDLGVIYGDSEGSINVFRNYWSNQATGLVNDVPGEIMLSPKMWGGLRFGDKP